MSEDNEVMIMEGCEYDASLPAIYKSDVGDATLIHRRSMQTRGYKTAFNKAMAALNSLVSALEVSPATTSLPMLRKAREAFERATENLTCCYSQISVLAETKRPSPEKRSRGKQEIFASEPTRVSLDS